MIWRWAFKSLLQEPGRIAGSLAAIAAAFALVLLFRGIWAGEAAKITAYLRHTDADLWVMQRGVSNMHMATSLLPDWKQKALAAVPGVADVTPLQYVNSVVELNGRRWVLYVVGLPSGAKRGGPWALEQGATLPDKGKALVPAEMARLAGSGIGGTIRIANKPLAISGLTSGLFSMVNSVVFIHGDDLADLRSVPDYVNYLMVKAQPGTTPEALAAAIARKVPDVAVLTRAEFILNDYRLSQQMGTELIGLFTVIGATLAVLLVAFMLYSHTLRTRRDLAILKAVGFPVRSLYLCAAVQGVVLSAGGFALSVALTYGGIAAAAWVAPQVAIQMTMEIAAQVGVAALAVPLAAIWIPARQVARIDPQSVFQG